MSLQPHARTRTKLTGFSYRSTAATRVGRWAEYPVFFGALRIGSARQHRVCGLALRLGDRTFCLALLPKS